MTKPPLGQVEAVLYVLQHVTKRGCARIMTHPLYGITRVFNSYYGMAADYKLLNHNPITTLYDLEILFASNNRITLPN